MVGQVVLQPRLGVLIGRQGLGRLVAGIENVAQGHPHQEGRRVELHRGPEVGRGGREVGGAGGGAGAVGLRLPIQAVADQLLRLAC